METKEWRLNTQFDKIKYLFCKLMCSETRFVTSHKFAMENGCKMQVV